MISLSQIQNIDLVNRLDLSKLNNPVTDIVDSYYIAKYNAIINVSFCSL